MTTREQSSEGALLQLGRGMFASAQDLQHWTSEGARAYWAVASRTTAILAGIGTFCVALFWLGYAFNKPALLTFAVLILGACIIVFMLLTAPIWGVSWFQPFRWIFKVLGFVFLWFLLLGLGFLVVPVTESTVVALPLGSAVVALLFALTGVGPDPKWIYRRVVIIVALSVAVPVVKARFPQSSEWFSISTGPLDDIVAKNLEGVSAPSPVKIETIQEFEGYPFFGQKQQPRLWYVRKRDGGYEFFNRAGFHPRTSERLQPVTPAIVSDLESQLRTKRNPRDQQGLTNDPLRPSSGGLSASDERPAEPRFPTASAVENRSSVSAAEVPLKAPEPTQSQREEKPLLSGRISPSFDCRRATSHAEQTVCTFPDLAILDLQLANSYRELVSQTPEDQLVPLRNSQRKWIRSVRDACDSNECLKREYLKRIADFEQRYRPS